MNSAGNNFSTVNVSAASNVTVVDTNALVLGALTLSGTFSAQAGGALTQSSALSMPSTASFTGTSITLTTAANSFGGAVSLSSGGNVSLSGGAIDLGTVNVTGTLGVTATGAITDSGNVVVTGATTLNAGTNAITLNSAGNNFGAVSVTAATNVTLVDTNALDLGAISISGTLDVASGGALTDSGNIVVPGTATLNAGSNAITLNSAGNDFSTVNVSAATNVTLVDTNALTLGTITLTGTLSATATGGALTQSAALSLPSTASFTGGSITLTTAANSFTGAVSLSSGGNVSLAGGAIDLGTVNVTGTLGVTATGAITDSANVVVTGATTLDAGTNAITLNSAGNNFSTVNVTAASNVTLMDSNALTLGTITLTGVLSAQAGALTQSSALSLPSTSSFTGSSITLTTATNSFSGAVSLSSGGSVSLTGGAIDLGAVNVIGNLNLTATGAITDSGNVVVFGTSTLNAGSNAVTLNSAGNNFGTVGITAASDVALVDTNGITLGASTVSGTLAVTAVGIFDSGNVVVTGTTTLDSGVGVTFLDSAGNDFSTVVFVTSNTVVLVDANALDLGASTITGGLTVTTGGALSDSGNVVVSANTIIDAGSNTVTLNSAGNDFVASVSVTAGDVTLVDSNALDLGASAIGGILNVTAAGLIIDSGALIVAGAATFNAGANAIILDSSGNDFSTLSITAATDATLVDANALDLGASTIGGILNVTAGGPLSDSGNLVVSGAAIFNTGSNAMTLNSAGNDFSTVSVNAATSVILVDANALDLGASSISVNLTVTAGGAITDSGNLVVGGATTLDAGSNAITLNNVGNDFSTVRVSAAGNVALVDVNDIDLDGSTISGTLSVTASGAITDSGSLAVSGVTTLDAGPNAITLDSAANNFGTVSVTAASSLILVDANALDLGAVTAGAVNVTAGAALTQSGALSLSGISSFGASSINLTNPANSFAGAVALNSSSNVDVSAAGALNLGTVIIIGNLGLTATGAIGNSTTVAVGGVTTIDAGANAVLLNSPGNNFGTVRVTAAGNVTLADVGAIDLGASTISGTLSVTAGSAITDSGNLAVTGNVTLSTGGNIVLDRAGNSFGGSVAISTPGNVTLVDSTALSLAASTIDGSLTATGNGITQTGIITVGGTSTLNGGGGAISLVTAGNDFVGAVSLTTTSTANLSDTNALTLGTISVGGALTINAGTTLAASDLTAQNAVSLTAGGNITFTGTLAVGVNTVTLVTGGGSVNLGTSTTIGTLGQLVAANGVTVGSGDSLSGTGTVDVGTGAAGLRVLSGGTLSPGAAVGTLTVDGDVVLTAGATLGIQLDDTGAGQFSQLNVVGGVTLGGATLSLSLGYSPAVSNSFQIITNDAADAISGTFASGSITTVGPVSFGISYAGGSNNDVVLTVANTNGTPPPALPTANGDVASLPEDSAATAIPVLVNDLGIGLTIDSVTQPISGAVVITGGGTGLTYQPNADFTGVDSFTYTVKDNDGDFSTATVIVAVTAVNDAPVLAAPAAATILPNIVTSLAGITVNDIDAGTGQMQVILSAANGTLTLGSVAGLSFNIGDGVDDSDMTFTGALASINNALAGLTYRQATDICTADTVDITINDLGNTGSGGNLSDTASITISPPLGTVQLLNDSFKVGTKALVITGVVGNDTISVSPKGTSTTTFLVTINGGPVQTFSGVTGRIMVYGQDGNDTITMAATVKKQTFLSGGAGNDTITGGSGADWISGGLDNDSIKGGPIGIGFDCLVESGNVDFTLVGGTTTVDGSLIGLGTDVLYRNTIETAKLTGGAGDNVFSITGFAGAATIDGGAGDDTLLGRNAASVWTITSNNAGTVGKARFSAIENLTGGTANDTFKFKNGTSVAGDVDGGGGGNTLNYALYLTAIRASLVLGTATGVGGGISNIRNVTGGVANDILVGNTAINLLLGGGGRDVLIGGADKDVLNGGGGDDILIGGTTNHDDDPTNLDAIMALWASTTNSYTSRITSLASLLSAATVQNDSAIDKLIGGTGLDWFLTSTGDVITDKNNGGTETQTTIP